MDFNKRIENISAYFGGFNIVDNISILLIKFPQGWSVFDINVIRSKYNVNVSEKPEGLYFLIETKDGVDNLFDAVEYVIGLNKALEEKSILLKEKANELRQIFLTEPLEKLKTLQFTFNEEKSLKSKKNSVKTKKNAEKPEDKLNKVIEEAISDQKDNTKKAVKEENKIQNNKAEVKQQRKKVAADSDNMSFIKNIVEE